jgi:ABC-2 type transport system ATP-binding protein
MIRVEGLTKDYGSRRAIDHLTFDAQQGQILGFLGPNGAGKTTTMRILSGYMPPSSGKATVAGFDVVDDSLEVRRRVGYMPETVPLYPDMTIYEYLKFMASLRHLKNSEERVDEALEQVNLIDRADGYIGNLSKGMRQRVGLAQALLHQPEVLILDEPTIGLDPAQIIEIRKLIRSIGKEKTVLLSTHILSEAQQVCDRILIINKGRIVVEDIFEHLQERISGAQRIALKVRSSDNGLVELVTSVHGVASVSSMEDGVMVETQPGEDLCPAVARAVVNAGYDLLEIRPVGASLEEIFLQLTREEPELVGVQAQDEEDFEMTEDKAG